MDTSNSSMASLPSLDIDVRLSVIVDVENKNSAGGVLFDSIRPAIAAMTQELTVDTEVSGRGRSVMTGLLRVRAQDSEVSCEEMFDDAVERIVEALSADSRYSGVSATFTYGDRPVTEIKVDKEYKVVKKDPNAATPATADEPAKPAKVRRFKSR